MRTFIIKNNFSWRVYPRYGLSLISTHGLYIHGYIHIHGNPASWKDITDTLMSVVMQNRLHYCSVILVNYSLHAERCIFNAIFVAGSTWPSLFGGWIASEVTLYGCTVPQLGCVKYDPKMTVSITQFLLFVRRISQSFMLLFMFCQLSVWFIDIFSAVLFRLPSW